MQPLNPERCRSLVDFALPAFAEDLMIDRLPVALGKIVGADPGALERPDQFEPGDTRTF